VTRREAPAPRRSRSNLVGLVLAAAAIGVLAWWGLRPRTVKRQPGQDVLLITIDTLRADALGAYGRAGAVTPRIDRLAATGVRFDFAHAHNVVTLPSHANILSGRYPFEHGVRDNSRFRFPPSVETLATLLKARGYHTGAFVSAFPLDSRFGLDRGFDVYDDRFGDPGAAADFGMPERPGPRTVAAARTWWDATPGPRFCWVHLYEPHAPYQPPAEGRDRFPTPYDGEVAAADTALGPLLDPLLAAKAGAHTLVVLTSDHGEGLGEHDETTHGIFTYETTLRVPLILHSPALFGSRVVGDSARHVDIVPTVLDALALEAPKDLAGRSLLGVAQGMDGGPTPPSYFESLTPALTRGWAPIHGVLRGHSKYVDLPLPELYDLAADPRELRNLVSSDAGAMDALPKLLAEIRASDRGPMGRAEDTDARERLRSLGYLGAGQPLRASYGEGDDPKRNMAFEKALDAVITSTLAGDHRAALAQCEALVRAHPRVPLGLRQLSFLRRQDGDLAGALFAARQAVAVDPGSVESLVELGRLLDDLGRPQETVVLLAPRAAEPEVDLDVLLTYGVALAKTGRRDESLQALGRARTLDPSSALAAYDLGTALLVFGDQAGARREFEQALLLDPEMGRAHGSLGVLEAVSGHPADAVGHWEKALAQNPRDFDTLLNLGTLLEREGRHDEARRHLERFLAEAPPARYAADLARVRAALRQAPAPRGTK
jgi:arylsulfatase A-like enzyme/tetratricopeptide (TPR) repeat protein